MGNIGLSEGTCYMVCNVTFRLDYSTIGGNKAEVEIIQQLTAVSWWSFGNATGLCTSRHR